MFSEKNIHPRSLVWSYGVLILLILMGSMAGCSSTPEADKLYSSEENVQASSTEETASLAPTESSSQTSVITEPISVAPYSPMDRAVILQYLEKGASDSGNLEAALKLVQRAEQLSPAERTMEDYLILAAHYRLKGDMQKVVQHANQGIMAKSENRRVKANMFIHLGYTYEGKSPVMARSYFNQATKIDPDFYKGHYESGRILFLEKKYSEARPLLKTAFNLDPKSPEVYGILGQMFYGMNQYEEAAESLKKALAMSPETHWIHLKLGDTYFYGLKQREEAGGYYQQAIAKSGSDPDTLFGVALYYRYKNEYIKAEEYLKKAMSLDEQNPRYKRELKDMFSEKEEMFPGIRKLKEAIEKNPADPNPVTQLARYYLRWRKFDKAEEQYKRAVQLAAKMDEVPVTKPDPEKPESDQPAEPVAKEPSIVPEHANNLGWFYFNDKKYTQAEKAFKTALKMNSKYTPAQFGLGRVYENLEQYDQAASYYTQAVALNPDNLEVKEHLIRLKRSGKLTPVGEMVETQEEEAGKKPVIEVKK